MTDQQALPRDGPRLAGRVIKSFGKRYLVATDRGIIDCGLRGRFRLHSDKSQTPVAVGDRVEILVDRMPHGVIEAVQPRRNRISRPDILHPDREQVIVANCDQLVVVASIAKPRLKLGAVDRLLLIAEKNGMDGVLVINKADLAQGTALQDAVALYRSVGYRTVVTSALKGDGLDELKDVVHLKTSMFCGHSGVGKSSLLNALQPGLKVTTGEISAATGKGIHTTTVVEMHALTFGGFVVDTPGIRAIGLWDIRPEDLPSLFREFRPWIPHCRFRDCMHVGEPDCAVATAVERGDIPAERFESYHRIRQTLL